MAENVENTGEDEDEKDTGEEDEKDTEEEEEVQYSMAEDSLNMENIQGVINSRTTRKDGKYNCKIVK